MTPLGHIGVGVDTDYVTLRHWLGTNKIAKHRTPTNAGGDVGPQLELRLANRRQFATRLWGLIYRRGRGSWNQEGR